MGVGCGLWETAFMESTLAHLTRLRLDLAYDGSDFHGWAAQPGMRTVEGLATEVIQTILRHPVALTVAGRTDAGVHARGQVAHVDVNSEAFAGLVRHPGTTPQASLRKRVNAMLNEQAGPPNNTGDVVVQEVQTAPEGFDARFSALSRTYIYRICDDKRTFDPLRRHDVLWHDGHLDIEAMQIAAQPLLGKHDFLSYCKPREGATTIRTLQRLEVTRRNGMIEMTAQADAFCHSMVRTLAGTLLRVGEGAQPITWPARRLEERLRNSEVIVAPPHPLTLEHVAYPPPDQLAARAIQTRATRECEC